MDERKNEAIRRVRRSARTAEAARASLEDAILIAADAGASLREIARAAGLNHETVRNVIRREKGDSDDKT